MNTHKTRTLARIGAAVTAAVIGLGIAPLNSVAHAAAPTAERKVNEYEGQHRKVNEYEGQHRKVNEYEGQHRKVNEYEGQHR